MSHLESNLPYYAARLISAMSQVLGSKRYSDRLVQVVPVNTHAEAPGSLHELKMDVAQGYLRVSREDSGTAIYGASGNLVFRAFHDAGHVHYNLGMTSQDEAALAVRQWGDIYQLIPPEDRWWCNLLYHADTVGQTEYYRLKGEHVKDQQAFVLQVCGICEKGHQSVREAVRRIVFGE